MYVYDDDRDSVARMALTHTQSDMRRDKQKLRAKAKKKRATHERTSQVPFMTCQAYTIYH